MRSGIELYWGRYTYVHHIHTCVHTYINTCLLCIRACRYIYIYMCVYVAYRGSARTYVWNKTSNLNPTTEQAQLARSRSDLTLDVRGSEDRINIGT